MAICLAFSWDAEFLAFVTKGGKAFVTQLSDEFATPKEIDFHPQSDRMTVAFGRDLDGRNVIFLGDASKTHEFRMPKSGVNGIERGVTGEGTALRADVEGSQARSDRRAAIVVGVCLLVLSSAFWAWRVHGPDVLENAYSPNSPDQNEARSIDAGSR